jgi:hypothetical protein
LHVSTVFPYLSPCSAFLIWCCHLNNIVDNDNDNDDDNDDNDDDNDNDESDNDDDDVIYFTKLQQRCYETAINIKSIN